jgi:DNA-binding NtrC family response regulator
MNPLGEKHYESTPGGTVLLVDEDFEYLEHLRRITQGMGYSVHACNSYAEGIRQLESGAFKFIVVGQGSRSFEGRCVVERAIKINRQLPVVVVARQLEMECYLEAMQLGAVDYVTDPSVGAEIARVLRNHLSHPQS